MADEQDKQPSLELPGVLSRRRKRRDAAAEAPPPAPEPAPGELHEDEPVEEIPAPPPEEPRAPAPAPDATPEPEPEPVVREERPEPMAHGTPLFADEAPAPETRSVSDTLLADQAPVELDEPEQPAVPARPRRGVRPLVRLAGYPAAALTGVLVGLLMVGLTAGGLQGCEAVRGTATCGGGVGTLLLVVILALLVVVGGLVLRAAGVPDPTATSFLAVGLVAVVSLLFLLEVLLSPWMLLVIPAISVLAYLAAQWVTTAFVEVDQPTR